MSHYNNTKPLKIAPLAGLLGVLFIMIVSQPAVAEGVFLKKSKAAHAITGSELNRIKAEHQLKFGQTSAGAHYSTNNPWEKKKQKGSQTTASSASWGDCRDYALHKRNRCYREGRDAYRCEQMYETRARLCDKSF